jgi:hypothetical protein
VDGRFGDVEQCRCLGDVETAEVPAFDHGCLPRVDPSEIVERGIERQEIVGGRRGPADRLVKGHKHCVLTSAPGGVAAPGGLDEHLTHGPGRDPFEVQR